MYVKLKKRSTAVGPPSERNMFSSDEEHALETLNFIPIGSTPRHFVCYLYNIYIHVFKYIFTLLAHLHYAKFLVRHGYIIGTRSKFLHAQTYL